MTRKSTHDAGATASQWQWKFGAARHVEWAWEMQSDPVWAGVGAAGILQPLAKKRVSEKDFPVPE
ncbi:MAG: hypothetical protein N2491_12660 [Negativicutes bacterium]|nr:hypothetical protein [Negativicutes bacterium]